MLLLPRAAALLLVASPAALLLLGYSVPVPAAKPVPLSVVNEAGCRRCTSTFGVSGDSRCAWLGMRPALRCSAALLALNVSSPLLLLSMPVASEKEEGLLPLPPVMSVAARPPPARALVTALRLVLLLGLCVCVM
jgi:hypothetical protein